MDFLSSLNDDQFALIGCAVAFFGFGGLMSLSYYLGNNHRSSKNQQASTQNLDAKLRETPTKTQDKHRRAA
ncbi:MAG: hypothetical protein Tsb009_07590 [Planctomycetaceae bacterium]